MRPGRERAGGSGPGCDGRTPALPPKRRRIAHLAQGHTSPRAGDHHRQRPGYDERAHLAQDAGLRRPGDGVQRNDTAVRRPRWRPEPGPGQGSAVLGARAHPAGRPRTGGRTRVAVPPRRRRPRRRRGRSSGPAQCARGATVSLHRAWSASEREEPVLVEITPEDAGWAWSGLQVIGLRTGTAYTLATGPSEVFVLPLSGGPISVEVAAEPAGDSTGFRLNGRASVFSAV